MRWKRRFDWDKNSVCVGKADKNRDNKIRNRKIRTRVKRLESMMETGISGYLIFINLITFALYGIDKRKAVKNQWRIRERTLLLLAAAGGAFGAWMGMKVFHHKTKQRKFTILVPVFAVLWIFLLVEMILQILCTGGIAG